MKILKTFKVNEYYEDMKKPQYVKMPKGTQIIEYRDSTGESLISVDELVDPKYTYIGIKSRQNVCLFDTNEIQPHI
jgi:hypothetical protein